MDYSRFKSIAIFGRPKVGKSTLAAHIKRDYGHELICTDHYISQVSFAEAPEFIIDKLKKLKRPYIVEGIQVARMLKRGAQTGSWQPELAILVTGNNELKKEHKGLSTVTENSLKAWLEAKNPDVHFLQIEVDHNGK